MGPIVSGVGALVVEIPEDVELRNTLASVFTAKASSQEPQMMEPREKVWRKEEFSLVKENQVRDNLDKFDTHKFIGPDGMHALKLRELAQLFCLSFNSPEISDLSLCFKG